MSRPRRGDTPSASIRAFVDAFNAREPAGMSRHVLSTGEAGFVFPDDDLPSWDVALGESRIEGDEATVEVVVTVSSDSAGAPATQAFPETVRLRRVDDDWLILPVDPEYLTRDRSDVSRWIGGLASLVTSPKARADAKAAATIEARLSGARLVAVATIQHAMRHEGRLPTSEGFGAAAAAYLGAERFSNLPGVPRDADGYFLDPRLSGVSLASIPRPFETAMVIQGTPERVEFPYEGRTILSYVGGHTELVDAPVLFAARNTKLR